MRPHYTQKIDLKIWKTNITAQKINNFILKIFKKIIANV